MARSSVEAAPGFLRKPTYHGLSFHTIDFVPDVGSTTTGEFTTLFADGSICAYRPCDLGDFGRTNRGRTQHNRNHAQDHDLSRSNSRLPIQLREVAGDHTSGLR